MRSERPSNSKLPNPFATALVDAGVTANLHVDDVLGLRPDWTAEQAQRFLRRHAAQIAHAMLVAGSAVAAQLAEVADDVN